MSQPQLSLFVNPTPPPAPQRLERTRESLPKPATAPRNGGEWLTPAVEATVTELRGDYLRLTVHRVGEKPCRPWPIDFRGEWPPLEVIG